MNALQRLQNNDKQTEHDKVTTVHLQHMHTAFVVSKKMAQCQHVCNFICYTIQDCYPDL